MYKKPRRTVNNCDWPSNYGCCGAESETILYVGNHIDRFGSENGYFFGVPGEPYIYRSLPWFGNYNVKKDNNKMKQRFYKFYSEADKNINPEHDYHLYKVIKPFKVHSCSIASAFGFPGGGTQYRSESAVKNLIQAGFIKEMPWIHSPFFDDNDIIPVTGGKTILRKRKTKTKTRKCGNKLTRRRK